MSASGLLSVVMVTGNPVGHLQTTVFPTGVQMFRVSSAKFTFMV